MSRKIFKWFLTVFVFFMAWVSAGFATVEWEILNTLQLDAPPVDVAISPDGKSVFVLTNDSRIHIYALDGRLKDKIDVDKQIDQIKLGPKGALLFVTSRKSKTVKVIRLDFINKINIVGSPYKGLQNAPIVLAEFSDFE
jgi:DNA-binding beta-propeller fold protein YncE